jgi:GT2 family glycosyltransferase
MSDPLVFIILLNWNGKTVTLECLDSLAKISYNNLKVVVIDNASLDGSVEAINDKHPQVTVVPQKENLGFAGGNNVSGELS